MLACRRSVSHSLLSSSSLPLDVHRRGDGRHVRVREPEARGWGAAGGTLAMARAPPATRNRRHAPPGAPVARNAAVGARAQVPVVLGPRRAHGLVQHVLLALPRPVLARDAHCMRRQLRARPAARRTARDRSAQRPVGPTAPPRPAPRLRVAESDLGARANVCAQARPPHAVLAEHARAEAAVGDGKRQQVARREERREVALPDLHLHVAKRHRGRAHAGPGCSFQSVINFLTQIKLFPQSAW